MSEVALYPLRFEPILKRLIWGGRRLGTLLGKPIGPEPDYAESWEISDHREGVSRVAEGPLAGTTLRELVRDRPVQLFGPARADTVQFPLLVKYLDANQVLSVQVHPDDELGWRLANDNGKTETWVILHAEPGSVLYAGLEAGVDRGALKAAIEANAIEPLLHRVEPRPGDCILIPAGTVHAIGAGIVLAEIQQMSDTTFRVHDWGRVGSDGQPRALHIREALASTDFEAGPVDPLRTEPVELPGGAGTREALSRTSYFALERLNLRGPTSVGSADRFTILLGLDGGARVIGGGREVELGRGQTLLLPACLGACRIEPERAATVLTCVVP